MAVGIVVVLGLVYVGYASASDIKGAIPSIGDLFSGSSGIVILGLAAVLSVVVGVGLAAVAVKYWFGSGVWVLSSLKRGWDRLTPNSILGRAALYVMVLLVVLMGFIGAIPAFTGDLSESDQGAVGFANRLSDQAMNSNWDAIIEGDAVGRTAACGDFPRDLPGGDADGDGLPDDWERAGETPSGAPLPGADPAHKDLYVQLNYGSTVEPLSPAEKRQLRETWASMPIDNPDGTEGIRLHLDDESPGAGKLGSKAVFNSSGVFDRYYNQSIMRERACVYHQVVVGQIDIGDTAGYGAAPGFYAVIDGTTRPEYDGDVSFRVAITTHELLHNVAGRVKGKLHTTEGWLAGGPENEFLSSVTAADLNDNGLTPVREPTSS